MAGFSVDREIHMFLQLIQFFKHQDTSHRRKMILVICLSLTGAILEMLGVGLFLPVMNFLVTDQIPQDVLGVLASLQLHSKMEISAFVIGALCAFFIFKNTTLTVFTVHTHRLIGELRFFISKLLFARYIHMPYSDLIAVNSSAVVKNLTTMMSNLNTYVLTQGSIFLTECLVIIALITLSLILMPQESAMLFSLIFIFSFIFFSLTKKRIARYGVDVNSNEAIKIRSVHDMVGSIRDIQLLDKKNFFIDRYDQSNLKVITQARKITSITQSTKYVLESILIVSITTLILFQLTQGVAMNSLIPALGFYAIAGFRIIPSINRLIVALQSIKYGEDILKTINAALTVPSNKEPVSPKKTFSFSHEIGINRVCFSYPGQADQVLRDVNMKIKKGEAVGICGETGSGKSTLINMLLGFLKPSSGSVTIDGFDVHQESLSLGHICGYVPQDIFLLDDSIRHNIAFAVPPDLIDKNKVERAIQEAGLESFIKKSKHGLDTIVGERGSQISGGQRQRIGIARAFYFGAKILIFDEATSALDEKTERLIMQNIRSLKGRYTLLIVAHRLSTLTLCDRTYELKDGRPIPFK